MSLSLCCESGALRTLERAGDTEGAIGWRWFVKAHEPDTAGHHASQILSFGFTGDTHGSLDTLHLLVLKYESSTGTPLAEPLEVALV